MTRYFVLYQMRTAAFVLVTCAAVFVVWHSQKATNVKIVASQINACERGNRLRAAVNADTRIVRYFMQTAVKALKARPDRASQERAALYAGLAAGLEDVSVPDCVRVVYHP